MENNGDKNPTTNVKRSKLDLMRLTKIILLLFLVVPFMLTLFNINLAKIIQDAICHLKPYSVLNFQKLDTPRPKGTICIKEGITDEVENKVIVYHDNLLDIYQSLSFTELIKTITFPGKIELVKFNFRNPGYHDWLYLADKGVNYNGTYSFMLAVVYNDNGKRTLRTMGIPTNRFIIWNAKFKSKTDDHYRDALDELFFEMENFKAKEKIINEIKAALDDPPKNPFDFFITLNSIPLHDNRFLTTSFEDIYLTSSDGKILYAIGPDKTERTIFANDKPSIWAYYYFGYSNNLVFVGYDGRNVLSNLQKEGGGYVKKDTHEDGILDKSFFTTNTININHGYTDFILWNGKHFFTTDQFTLEPLFIGGDNFKPTASSSSYLKTFDGKTIFINFLDEVSKGFFYIIDFDIKSTSMFYSENIRFNSFTNYELWNMDKVSLAIDNNSNPLIVHMEYPNDNIKYYNIQNVDEPVEELYTSIENGKLTLYLLNSKTIYRWEGTKDGLSNYKPRIINFDEKNKIPFELTGDR